MLEQKVQVQETAAVRRGDPDGFGLCAAVLADDFDLPGNFSVIQVVETGAGDIQIGR